MGEQVGQTLINGAIKYDFVHMVGHSAGSNLLRQFGRQLGVGERTDAEDSRPFWMRSAAIQIGCDYGYWSEWADSYIDTHSVFPLEGRQTHDALQCGEF